MFPLDSRLAVSSSDDGLVALLLVAAGYSSQHGCYVGEELVLRVRLRERRIATSVVGVTVEAADRGESVVTVRFSAVVGRDLDGLVLNCDLLDPFAHVAVRIDLDVNLGSQDQQVLDLKPILTVAIVGSEHLAENEE